MTPTNPMMPSRKKPVILSAIVAVLLIYFGLNYHLAYSYSTGAPPARTGSPGDGFLDCTACHTGTSVPMPGLITSNIPGSGYLPGNTYTITGTISAAGKVKFGFEISPQAPNGAQLGTMLITNGTTTRFATVSQKYVTHQLAGTSAPGGSRSWSFDWVAPAAGTGDVTFYGAFNSTNSNGSTSGDAITLSTLTVSEDITAGIGSPALVYGLATFPNPASDHITVRPHQLKRMPFQASVVSLNGSMHSEAQMNGGDNLQFDVTGLAPGVYLLKITQEGKHFVSKFIKI